MRCRQVPVEGNGGGAAVSWPPAADPLAFVRTSASARPRNQSEPSVARRTIMMAPPTNSAATNCQPMRTARTIPSSITRFVDATMKIKDATKSAPRRTSTTTRSSRSRPPGRCSLDDGCPVDAPGSASGRTPGQPPRSRTRRRAPRACPRACRRLRANFVRCRRVRRRERLRGTGASSQSERTFNLRRGKTARSRPHESLHRGRRLAHLFVRVGAARRHRVTDAVVEVVAEELDRDGLQRPGGRGDLGQDVDAVHIILNHALETPHLTLDAAEAAQDRVLLSRVATLDHWATSLLVVFPFLERVNTPPWYRSTPLPSCSPAGLSGAHRRRGVEASERAHRRSAGREARWATTSAIQGDFPLEQIAVYFPDFFDELKSRLGA